MSRYALIGTEFITIFGLFLFAGVMLDRKFQPQPVLTLVGLAAGFAMGLCKMVTDLRRHAFRWLPSGFRWAPNGFQCVTNSLGRITTSKGSRLRYWRDNTVTWPSAPTI
jgi:hypothetical protein